MHPPSSRAVGVELDATGEQQRSSPETLGNGRILDDKISIPNKNTVEVSPEQEVYKTASRILALFRVSALVLPHLQELIGGPTRTS